MRIKFTSTPACRVGRSCVRISDRHFGRTIRWATTVSVNEEVLRILVHSHCKAIRIYYKPGFRIGRIRMLFGLPDPHPDPLVISTDPNSAPDLDPDPSRFS